MTHYTDLPTPVEPSLVVYRYGHLYVVQERHVSVLRPGKAFEVHELDFAPTTWASYGGNISFYGPDGLARFVGVSLESQYTDPGVYAAPMGMLQRDGVSLEDKPVWTGAELNGVPYERFGDAWIVKHLGITFYQEPRAGLVEPHQTLMLFEGRKGFSYYNGVAGDLLYADVPEKLVPYLYPQQGLMAAGCEDGYLFSPDMGISWRRRKLSGFGAMTERGVLEVSAQHGIRAAIGSW